MAVGILLSAAAHATPLCEPIRDHGTLLTGVRFEGNERTREAILRQEIGLREGDTVTGEQIEAARQAIMDLGLFKWVRADLETTPRGDVLFFSMEEKFFILPIPLLNGDPNNGDYSYGLELRVDNLGGLNQRVRLKYEEEKSQSKETPSTQSAKVDWSYPRVNGSAYNVGLSYGLTQEEFHPLDADGEPTAKYHRNITSAGGSLSRWLNIGGPSRGWYGGVGINYRQQAYTFLSGVPGAFDTQQSVSLAANIGNSDVHDYRYYFSGSAYGWNGEVGSEAFGSDFNFTRHLFYYRVYDHITPTINLNWQARIGFADGRPFGDDTYGIGGFSTLRGYEDEITGNAFALSNFEYHHQLDRWPTLRGVWFLDVGNAYHSITDMEPGRMEAGTGFGLRWRVQSLVNVTISADAAYGLSPGKTVFYLMTTGTF